MSIMTSVTEIEDRFVDTVRSIQQPVVEYVRKGVERTEARLPKLTYPESLPKPAEVVESGFNFAKTLIDTQREFVSGLVDAVAPLVRSDDQPAVDADAEGPTSADPASKTKAAPATAKPKAKRSAS